MLDSIKVGYDSKTKLYTFKAPGMYTAKNVCVNGKPITDPLRGQKVGELMTINEKPETITYETSERGVIQHFQLKYIKKPLTVLTVLESMIVIVMNLDMIL